MVGTATRATLRWGLGTGVIPWLIIGAVVLLAAQVALVILVSRAATQATRQQADAEREALLAHATRVLVLAQVESPERRRETLTLLRDAHKLDAVHILDAVGRVVAAPQLAPADWGSQASPFLVAPDHLAAVVREAGVEVRRLELFGEPIERILLPLDAANGPRQFLCIDRRDHLAVFEQAWRRPVRLGALLATAIGLLLVVVGIWLMRSNRQAGVRWQRLDSLSSVGQLAAGVAHEIRNPLGIIGSCLDLLRRHSRGDPRAVELITTAEEEIQRMDDQIDLFLDLTRDQPLDRRPISLSALVHDVHRLMQHQATRAGVDLAPVEVAPAAAAALIDGDPRRLRQALVNILLNAIQAQSEGGGITCRIFIAEAAVVLEVVDQGPGFPTEVLRRVGEPFLTRKPGGTGLGLSLCRRILHRHGGRLELDNTGTGALVRWRLPKRGG